MSKISFIGLDLILETEALAKIDAVARLTGPPPNNSTTLQINKKKIKKNMRIQTFNMCHMYVCQNILQMTQLLLIPLLFTL